MGLKFSTVSDPRWVVENATRLSRETGLSYQTWFGLLSTVNLFEERDALCRMMEDGLAQLIHPSMIVAIVMQNTEGLSCGADVELDLASLDVRDG